MSKHALWLLASIFWLMAAVPAAPQVYPSPTLEGLTLRNCTGAMTAHGAGSQITCTGASPTNPSLTVRAVTGATDTILSTDNNKLVTYSGGAAVTLPQATGSFAAPFCFAPQNTGASPVVITPSVSNINGVGSLTLATKQGVVVCSDGANWQIGYGGLGSAGGGGSTPGFLAVTDPSVGMVAGNVDNAPKIAALMAAINPGVGTNQWTGGGNVVFPTVFGQSLTTYYFKSPLRLSRGGTYQCGISAGSANFTNIVFDPGIDGFVLDSFLTSVDGGLSNGADVNGCGVISLGIGSAKSFNGSNTFTNVLMNGFGTIPSQPWTPGDGILATIVFPEVFNYIAFIGGSSYTASISGTTMTVTATAAGSTAPAVGQPVAGSPVAVPVGTLISASCGANCWTLNQSGGTIASEAMYDNQIVGNIMTVTTNPSNVPATAIPGVIAAGQHIQSASAYELLQGGTTIASQVSGTTGGQGIYTISGGTQALDAQGIVSTDITPVTTNGAYICATATAFISPCVANAAAGSITLASPYTAYFFQPNGVTPIPVETWRFPAAQKYVVDTDYGLIRCAPTPCTPFGAITGGTGGTPGTYPNVPLTGGSGTEAVGTIVVGAGGNVTAVNVSISGVGVNSVEGPATTGMINQPLGAITGGSGGTPGVYYGVPFTGGTGQAAKGIVTVGAGGNVTGVTIAVGSFVAGSFNPAGNNRGYGYTAGDVLSASPGGVTGFSFIVASVSSGNSPGKNFVVGDVLSAASGTIGGVTGFSMPVTSVMGNANPVVRSGPRFMAQGDELWVDAYPMGSIVGVISPQLSFPQFPTMAQTPTMSINVYSTVAHASGSGQAWNLPASNKRRVNGHTHKNYVSGWVFGQQMTCSAGDGMNCGGSTDDENTYISNFIGRITGGDNTTAASYGNVYGKNYQFDVAELGTLGSGYVVDSFNSCEAGTSHYCYVQNCANLNFSALYSVYVGNQPYQSCAGSPITPFTVPTGAGINPVLQFGALNEIPPLVDAATFNSGQMKNCWAYYNSPINQALRLNCQGNILSFSGNNTLTNGYAWWYNPSVGAYDLYANNSTPTVLERLPVTAPGLTNYIGYKADGSEAVYPHGVLLGGTAGAFPTPGTERWLREMAAKPVEASNIQGNVAFNNAAILGGTAGWIHTSAGAGGATPFGPVANDTAGNFWTFPGTIQTTITYSAAGTPLPTCNTAEKGAKAMVSDAASPTYLTNYASGGSVVAPVFCNGANWLTD